MTIETEFVEAIALVASGLGIAAERVFGVFVGAQQIIGFINIVSIVIIWSVAYLAWKWQRKFCIIDFKDEVGNWNSAEDEIRAGVYPLIGASIVLIVMYFLMWSIGNSALKIACPEYTAAKEIIELVMP